MVHRDSSVIKTFSRKSVGSESNHMIVHFLEWLTVPPSYVAVGTARRHKVFGHIVLAKTIFLDTLAVEIFSNSSKHNIVAITCFTSKR